MFPITDRGGRRQVFTRSKPNMSKRTGVLFSRSFSKALLIRSGIFQFRTRRTRFQQKTTDHEERLSRAAQNQRKTKTSAASRLFGAVPTASGAAFFSVRSADRSMDPKAWCRISRRATSGRPHCWSSPNSGRSCRRMGGRGSWSFSGEVGREGKMCVPKGRGEKNAGQFRSFSFFFEGGGL